MSFWNYFQNYFQNTFSKKRKNNTSRSVKDSTSINTSNGVSDSITEKEPEVVDNRNEDTSGNTVGVEQFDSRNTPPIMSADGSLEDYNPQSWENTTRRIRNGVPTESDLVSRIMYNATNGTTTIDTKRGNSYQVLDDGSTFTDIENAGSKGRWAIANVGY